MVSAISRGPITARLLLTLAATQFPVGDNTSPETDYGWQGEPNSEDQIFIPYLGLTPLNAQPQRVGQGGALGDSQREWTLPYQVWYAGISRVQTEALADRVRGQLTNTPREVIETPTGSWKLQQIRCTVIGGNSRVGSAYPDYYTQTDTFEVWTSKEK